MKFIADLIQAFNSNIRNLKEKASDVLPISEDLEAIRVDGEVHILDLNKKKIVEKFRDTFPSNAARTVLQLQKKLNIHASFNYLNLHTKESNMRKASIWTCGFRKEEERWVWYENSEPKMTLSFNERYPYFKIESEKDLEKKIEFCSASFATEIIDEIKKMGLKKVATKLNAHVLENSFVEINCTSCGNKDNYTIDDLVDENKQAKYDSNFVVCSNCNDLIKL